MREKESLRTHLQAMEVDSHKHAGRSGGGGSGEECVEEFKFKFK